MESSNRRITDANWCDIACVIAILYTVGYFLVIWSVVTHPIPAENRDAFNILLGILSVIQAGIVQFYFGGSRSAEMSQKANIEGRAKSDSAIQSVATSVPSAVTTIVTKPQGDVNVT